MYDSFLHPNYITEPFRVRKTKHTIYNTATKMFLVLLKSWHPTLIENLSLYKYISTYEVLNSADGTTLNDDQVRYAKFI